MHFSTVTGKSCIDGFMPKAQLRYTSGKDRGDLGVLREKFFGNSSY
jgi:hypothetical protein